MEEINQFVYKAMEKGSQAEKIKQDLLAAGWEEKKVDEALDQYQSGESGLPVPRPKPYISAKEAFIYLLTFLALYIAAFNIGSVLFEFIEKAFPDAARSTYYYSDYSSSQVRFGVAAMVITLPLYLWLSWRNHREIQDQPAKRDSKIRKWLTYLTLFIAAGFIVGDLITLVYYFLGGEITVRFILKVIVVLVLTGTIFSYYLYDIADAKKDK